MRRDYLLRPRALTHAERQRALALMYRMRDMGTRSLARPVFDAAVFSKLRADGAELLRIVLPDVEADVIDQLGVGEMVRIYLECAGG